MKRARPGYFGPYGGRRSLPRRSWSRSARCATRSRRRGATRRLDGCLRDYAGRPNTLFAARNLSAGAGGATILLKREDLLHTGRAQDRLGQAPVAKRMTDRRRNGRGSARRRLRDGQRLLGLECVVYMGVEDVRRQAVNVDRMKRLGAEVRAVDAGSEQRDQRSDARVERECAHDALPARSRSAAPYPTIGRVLPPRDRRGGAPAVPEKIRQVAGGGRRVRRRHVPTRSESSGVPPRPGAALRRGGGGPRAGPRRARAAAFGRPRRHPPRHAHRTCSKDSNGQIAPTHSSSAGLDYPAIGPLSTARLREEGRVEYAAVGDRERVLPGLRTVDAERGDRAGPRIRPRGAFAAALAPVPEVRSGDREGHLSGRGDKDLAEAGRLENP